MLSDLKWALQIVRSLYDVSVSVGFIDFGPNILQNPERKSNNYIPVLNTFLHEKPGITWSTSLTMWYAAISVANQNQGAVVLSSTARNLNT